MGQKISKILFILFVLAAIGTGVWIAIKTNRDYDAKQAQLKAQEELEKLEQEEARSNADVTDADTAKNIQPKQEGSKSVGKVEHTSSAFPPPIPTLTVPSKKEEKPAATKEAPKSQESGKVEKKSEAQEKKTTVMNDSNAVSLAFHQQIVSTLREKIKNQEITIKDLKKTVQNLKKNMQGKLVSIKKPTSDFVAECYDMGVGSWEITPACQKKSAKALASIGKKHKDIIAWEVLPVVDSRPYKGLSPELKQEGLASFRAQSGIRQIHAEMGKSAVAFKGLTINEATKRGFVIKVHYLK